MKNILFVSLLVSINVLVISCLPPNNQEKCNKFLDDHHNPLAKKVDDLALNKNNYMIKGAHAVGFIFTIDEVKNMKPADVLNNIITKLTTNNTAKTSFKNQFASLETSFNNYKAAATSAISALDEAIKADDTGCKNSNFTVTTINKKIPGESSYKEELKKMKEAYETDLNSNINEFNQIKQAL